MQISGLSNGFPAKTGGTAGAAGAASSGPSFADELKGKIEEVNQLQVDADKAREEAALTGATNMHETLIKIEEASISAQMLFKVRNKALDAYHEVMRMQF
jgi:flagellar hook-basal body complex protein FliE